MVRVPIVNTRSIRHLFYNFVELFLRTKLFLVHFNNLGTTRSNFEHQHFQKNYSLNK